MKRFRRMARRAEDELDRHTEPSGPEGRKYAHPGQEDPETLRMEQHAETAQTVAGGGPVPMTSAQWKGMVVGGLVCGLIGALALQPVALVPFVEAILGRVLILAAIGFVAGATVGAIYWGGRTPELEGETVDVNGRPSIGTTPRDPRTDERGR